MANCNQCGKYLGFNSTSVGVCGGCFQRVIGGALTTSSEQAREASAPLDLTALIAKWRKSADREDAREGTVFEGYVIMFGVDALRACADELEQLLAVDGGRVSPAMPVQPGDAKSSSSEGGPDRMNGSPSGQAKR